MLAVQADRKLTQTRLFIGALGVGGLSILAGKLFPSGYVFFVLAILVPIVVMIGYAYFNHRVGFLDSTRAQVADNAYFLGFLYFLISLAITLAQVSAGQDQRIEVEPIIRGFGIALATTIVGLFLRIIVLQSIVGLTSAREKAEESLLQAVNRFKAHVDTSLDLLTQTREGILTTLSATGDAAQRVITELTENTKEATATVTKGYVDGLVAATKVTTEELGATVASFKTKIADMKLPSDALTAAIEPHLAELQRVLAQMNQRTAETGTWVAASGTQIRKFEAQLRKLNESLPPHVEGIEKLLSKLTAGHQAIQDLEQRAQGAGRSLEQFELQVTEIAQSLQALPQAGAEARAILCDIEKAIQSLKEALNATILIAADDAKTFTQVTDGLRTSVQELATSARGALATMQQDIQTLGGGIQDLQEEMRRAEITATARPWWRIGG